MYFCEIKNFAYGEINERSFGNPHPQRKLFAIFIWARYIDTWDAFTNMNSFKFLHG